jgi:hypothetical protein
MGRLSTRSGKVKLEYIRLNPRFMRKRQVFRTVLSARVVAARVVAAKPGWGCRPQSRGGFAERLFVA